MVTGVYWRYDLTGEQRARFIRSTKMNSCTRLSISFLTFLRRVMNIYVMRVVKGDGPGREGKTLLMSGENMSAVH